MPRPRHEPGAAHPGAAAHTGGAVRAGCVGTRALRAMPRRVLMTADTVGGVFSYSVELCRGLARHGVEVALATMGSALAPAQRAALAGLAGVEVFESRYRLEWMQEPWADVDRAGAWLLALEASVRPDVVHLNGYAHGCLPWRAPVLVVAHSCVLSWWHAVKGEDAPRAFGPYRRRVGEGLAGASLVVAPTRAMLEALVACHGSLPATRVIWNGRDARHFAAGRKEPLVFSAGRLWDEAKNLAALIESSAFLPWPVYVAGPTRHPDQAPGWGEAANANANNDTNGNLHLLGPLAPADMARWLARAAIYALPARYEPFGLSALEAALAGCALVLGDIGSLRELWGDAAVLVPPADPEAIAHAIDALARDQARRRLLARRARDRAIALTPERMVEQYLSAYEEITLGCAPTRA